MSCCTNTGLKVELTPQTMLVHCLLKNLFLQKLRLQLVLEHSKAENDRSVKHNGNKVPCGVRTTSPLVTSVT